jgi:hypothetical protein
MTNEPRLPPGLVFKVDQRIAQCGDALDQMIAAYQVLVRKVGTAGAQGELAVSFRKQIDQNPKAVGVLRDVLVTAIARLAEEEGE